MSRVVSHYEGKLIKQRDEARRVARELYASLKTARDLWTEATKEVAALRAELEAPKKNTPTISKINVVESTAVPADSLWFVGGDGSYARYSDGKITSGITDGFGNWWPDLCPACGAPMQVIRPGDARCSAECYLKEQVET